MSLIYETTPDVELIDACLFGCGITGLVVYRNTGFADFLEAVSTAGELVERFLVITFRAGLGIGVHLFSSL